MPSARKAPTTENTAEIATVRIELRDSDPLIWREVEVPTSLSLEALHDIIQILMGWADCHLWEFTADKQRYGVPAEGDWGTPPLIAGTEVRLHDVLNLHSTNIDYLYDFGDSWELRVAVTNVRAGEPGVAYPRYIGGECNAPPEDCGGIPGFYAMLDIVADRDHPEHAHLKKWLGKYDPSHINTVAIKRGLGRIASQRSAAPKRPAPRP
jgi:hypothetical protein